MSFPETVVKEYNRYMADYVEAWGGSLDTDKANTSAFFINAISTAVRLSNYTPLKDAFEKGAYIEYKNTLFKVEQVGSKFEGQVLLPPPDALYKLGFQWVRTLLKDTRGEAHDAAQGLIDRLED